MDANANSEAAIEAEVEAELTAELAISTMFDPALDLARRPSANVFAPLV